jgi:Tfp pilus assembly protein PilP
MKRQVLILIALAIVGCGRQNDAELSLLYAEAAKAKEATVNQISTAEGELRRALETKRDRLSAAILKADVKTLRAELELHEADERDKEESSRIITEMIERKKTNPDDKTKLKTIRNRRISRYAM